MPSMMVGSDAIFSSCPNMILIWVDDSDRSLRNHSIVFSKHNTPISKNNFSLLTVFFRPTGRQNVLFGISMVFAGIRKVHGFENYRRQSVESYVFRAQSSTDIWGKKTVNFISRFERQSPFST